MSLAAPLARVKLARPSTVDELVHRHRLLDWLDQAVKKPVTLLAAPAGYGKSTLLAEWLNRTPRRAAWLALDESDSNLALYSSYLVAAIQGVFPGSMQVTTALVNSTVPLEPLPLATTLSNEIAELPGDFVLVLDDYHTLNDLAVHELMGGLIGLLPEPLRLIIATRTNVPLPLAKLRTRGQLNELRAKDLRFTLDETRQFLELVVGPDIPADLVQRIQERIEGWPVGLHLATLVFIQGAPSPEMVEHLVNGSNIHMMDYLLDEVLLQKSPALQDFMLRTCFMPRFTKGLADAVLNEAATGKAFPIIEELVRDEVLMQEGDGEERTYKYLDLVREFLRTRASGRFDAQSISEINRRASKWFLRESQVLEAIQYAIHAGEEQFAAQIVEEQLYVALDQPWARPHLELWLRQFSARALETHVELLVARMWLASVELKLSALPPLIARAEELVATATDTDTPSYQRMQSALAYHRAVLAYFAGDARRSLESIAEYARAEPLPSAYARGTLITVQAWSLQMSGDTEQALGLLTSALQGDGTSSPGFTARILTGFVNLYADAGDWVNLDQSAHTTLRLTQRRPTLSTASAYYALGLVYYERNELEAAAQNFSMGAELSQLGNVKVGQESFGWLALTRQVQGSTETANQVFQAMVAFTDAAQSGALLYDLEAYRARLALLQGNLDVALRWAQGVAFNPKPHVMFEIEASLSRLHILLSARKPDLLPKLIQELEALIEWAESVHSTRRLVQLLALYAMAVDQAGDRVKALDILERAIVLAEPGKWIRTFLDLGPGMARMLNQLASRRRYTAFINRILMANVQQGKKRPGTRSTGRNGADSLIEPLTMRELQVLQGMARRLSNKEIAQELVISPQTVKAHIDHIHQKLGVNNRQDATKVALAYGIIETPSGVGEFA